MKNLGDDKRYKCSGYIQLTLHLIMGPMGKWIPSI